MVNVKKLWKDTKSKNIILFLLFWLLLVNIFGILVLNRFNLKGDTAYSWIDPLKTVQEQSYDLIDIHSRWDSFFYEDIANNGYHLTPGDTLSNIVFFPLYPFLIHIFSFIFLGNSVFAGWFVSIISLFGAVIVFKKLLEEFHPTINPETPIFYLLIFPTAFFLNAIYTESLFLLLSLLTFYYSFKKNFKIAGIFGFLAALTRVTGVLLFIPVVWEFYKSHGVRKMLTMSFMPILLIPLGTFLFFLYHYFAFGDFFLFLEVEKAWGRAFQINKEHFLLFSHPATINFFLDISFSFFALISAYHVFKKRWISYGLYIIATLCVALSTGTFMSIGRYILVLFPMYIALGTIKNEHFEKIYTFGSLLLLALNITLFVNWYWAG